MRHRDVPIGPLVAGAGAVLLIVSLFLDWYEGLTGFTVFELVDLLLVALALATVASLAASLGVARAGPPAGMSLAMAALALLVVLSQVVNDPPAVAGEGGPGQDLGIWLGLGGAALMVGGALLAYAHISLAVDVRPRGARGAGGEAPEGGREGAEAPHESGARGRGVRSGEPPPGGEERP